MNPLDKAKRYDVLLSDDNWFRADDPVLLAMAEVCIAAEMPSLDMGDHYQVLPRFWEELQAKVAALRALTETEEVKP